MDKKTTIDDHQKVTGSKVIVADAAFLWNGKDGMVGTDLLKGTIPLTGELLGHLSDFFDKTTLV